MALKRGRTRKASESEARFVLREVQTRDLEALYGLSAHLDSVNIPHDRKVLRSIIKTARSSFLGKLHWSRCVYFFVMENLGTGEIVGTSLIFGQHGHPDDPHVFFDVVDDERYSSTLDRHFSHTTLRLGFNYRGPTEIGALVLDPSHRGLSLGKPLSFVRFLFIAMYRERFREQVIAELMPPLESDGRSRLWEHLGRHFTGLGYQEADKLSHHNKEFIYALFPQSPLYASLLPPEVRELIGRVGQDTKGVLKMIKDIGFRYSQRIDPFDGGPHYEAKTADIVPIRDARRLRLSSRPLEPGEDQSERPVRCLIATGRPEGPMRFLSTVGLAHREGASVHLEPEVSELLAARPKQDIWITPL
ncbi:MAG: arginine N-succinyltransferase [Myxococcota bacterium]